MDLTLKIKGKDKNFTPGFISGRMFRRTLEINKKLVGGISDPEDLDSVIDFVVDLYDEKFTRDEFYDGIAGNKLVSTVTQTLQAVTSQASDAMDEGEEKNE